MLERSGASAYGPHARRMAQFLRASYQPGKSSSPTVIADVISSALRARRPRRRYVAGKHARALIFSLKWGGDVLLDRTIRYVV